MKKTLYYIYIHLRSSPCVDHPQLERFDSQLRSGLSCLLNIDISDLTWIQASLPVRDGGLGIRSAALLAPSAFLASAASTKDLQSMILQFTVVGGDPWIDVTAQAWRSRYSSDEPDAQIAHMQRSWDSASVSHATRILFDNARDDRDRARLLAVVEPHSGDWLHALPISSCGLLLDDETIRVAVGLRLGIAICSPHACGCGSNVDSLGTHGLSCHLGIGRLARHHQINDFVCRSLERAGIPSRKEPVGLFPNDDRRPDGITIIPWQRGKCMTWDVTVVDTFAATYLRSTAVKAGAAADRMASFKRDKYNDLPSSYLFCPIAIETMGSIEGEGRDFLSTVGHMTSNLTGDLRETAFLFQRLSVLIQRGNAAAFKSTFQQSPSPPPRPFRVKLD